MLRSARGRSPAQPAHRRRRVPRLPLPAPPAGRAAGVQGRCSPASTTSASSTDVILGDAADERKDFVFAVGLEHGNSTIGNTVMNVVFLREHNRVAGVLQEANPDWDDERLFQTARNVMIVMLLNLVVQEYIMHIAPLDFPLQNVPFMADGAPWNRSNWIAIEFNLLYRWHSLVPDVIGDGDDRIEPARLPQQQPAGDRQGDRGPDHPVLRGAGRYASGCRTRPGSWSTATIRTQPSVEERTVRLMRERPPGARTTSTARRSSSSPRKSFEELTRDAELRERLQVLYGTIDRLEWYVGIFAEDYGKNSMMGGLLTTMVAYDAFTQALTNPLLARNVYNEATFSPAGWKEIRTTKSLQQIVDRNSNPDKKVQASFKA